ncbi:MAG: 6-carboxytetrahydropterin synthase [Bacteroidales bacterium]|jgi:6-pyruvoyltetrahydropterin/6-carboxytetrahydropterin synthase|nr:6-carboxytetrahydropterin synthase [Bacteroidales bacterium]
MQNIRITKIFHFEMAHALENYDGLCRNIHGHSYKLHVTLIGLPSKDDTSPKKGMLIDFSDVKKLVRELIVDKYDHALVLNQHTDTIIIETLKQHYQKIITVPFQPTSELLLIVFAEILNSHLPANAKLYSLRLNETDTSYAEWFASDNEK